MNPKEGNVKTYMAFVAGSGITPVLSMISSVLEIEKDSKFVLVYGNKTMNDIMFKDEIDMLCSLHNDRFDVHYILSRSSHENHLFGRIDASLVERILNDYNGVDIEGYFLCGPEPMINLVKEEVSKKDVDTAKIHFELFTTSTEATTTDEIESLDGESEVKVLLDDEEEIFTMPRQSTILEHALLSGVDAPYSCQGGICSSCLAKVTEGKASMVKNSILSEEEVQEGLILTCQAHPMTAKITVDYDDI